MIRLVGVASLTAICLAPVAAQTRPAAKSTAAAPQETKELYGMMCQACHGPEGKPVLKEMGFVGRQWKHGTSSTAMIKTITDGVPGTAMMPFKGRLTDDQIRDLARYVRSLDKTLKPEKPAKK